MKLNLLFYVVCIGLAVVVTPIFAQHGDLDLTFDSSIGANINNVVAIHLQTDGRILIGGSFTQYNGVSRTRIARLNIGGGLDATFNTAGGANLSIYAIETQPDGRIVIGGGFTTYNGVARARVARINSNGNIDATFDAGTEADGIVWDLALQPDGQILIGGEFTHYSNLARNRIARLNSDGTLDATFSPGLGANDIIYSIVLQPNGQILIGGAFSDYNGTPRNGIARLNPDGSIDPTFDPGAGANGIVQTMALQSDGRILIGGDFLQYNGVNRSRIARLNPDGSLDATFDPGTGANNTVRTMMMHTNGRIVIGGNFTQYNAISRNRIARLNADGSLDTTFNPGTGITATVYSLASQPDGKILVGGGFTSYDGVTRGRIARLTGLEVGAIPTLDFSCPTLSISSGSELDLSCLLDNTDSQQLSLVGTDLSITDGNTVDVSSLRDNLGNHIVTQNLLPASNIIDLGSATNEYGSLYFYRALYTDGGEFLHTRDNCIAIGNASLPLASSGGMNVAIGDNTLNLNTSGSNNIAIGFDALTYNTIGKNNIVIGNNAGPTNGNGTFNNSIALGSEVILTASDQVRIGNGDITSIGGYANWTNLSDGRFKKEVREDIPGLAFIEKLRPVSYELDRKKLHTFLHGEDTDALTASAKGGRSIGFIAQEVERVVSENRYVFSGVDKPQNEHDHYGLRYAEFVVPLVKGMQEQQELIKSLQELVNAQQQRIETLESRMYGNTASSGEARSNPPGSEKTKLEGYQLYQNTPNPFDKTTVISAFLPEGAGESKIIVYNLQGLELATYPLKGSGRVSVEISGGRLPSGMYLYALVADGQVIDTKKMILTN